MVVSSEIHTLADYAPGEDVDLGSYIVEGIFRLVGLDLCCSDIVIVESVTYTAEGVDGEFIPVVADYTVVAFVGKCAA